MGVYDKLLKKHYTPPQRQTPAISQEVKQQVPTIKKSDEPTNRRNDEVTNRRYDEQAIRRSGEGTKRRTIERRSMDFYKDQLDTLKNRSLREELAGRRIGISHMLRKALDEYIAKYKLKPDEPTK